MLPLPAPAARNELSFSPTALNFGDVAVDQSKTLQVSVTNNGLSSVTISRISSSNRAFSLSNANLTITPSPLSFGNVAVGATGTLTLGLSATGGSVTISSVSSSSSLFAVAGAE